MEGARRRREKTEKCPLLWERRRNTARCGERAAAGGVLGPQRGTPSQQIVARCQRAQAMHVVPCYPG